MKGEPSQLTDGPSTRSPSCESRLPPRWVAPASMIITVLAVADSAYLTYAHFTTPKVLICSTKGFIDCAAVTTSSYSHPFGIPVALAGLVWSVAMLALCTPWAWRALTMAALGAPCRHGSRRADGSLPALGRTHQAAPYLRVLHRNACAFVRTLLRRRVRDGVRPTGGCNGIRAGRDELSLRPVCGFGSVVMYLRASHRPPPLLLSI